MIARIAKRFTFDAAHFIPGLPPNHKCSRMHGHTYEVEIQLVGPVDDRGFVIDYADIAEAWRVVHDLVDHQTLNHVAGLEQPTTENLAAWIVRRLANHDLLVKEMVVYDSSGVRPYDRPRRTLLERVVVRESSTTWCEVIVEAGPGIPATWWSLGR